MRHLLTLLAGLIAFQFCAADEKSAEIPKVPSGDEFTNLRMTYAGRKDFNPAWEVEEARDAIMKAVKDGDYRKVAELSKPWLEKVPVDADVHFARAQALKKLGDWAGCTYHWHCFYGLIHSIASSGDGKTAKTAYKVISVGEEYCLLDEFGAQVVEQTLEHSCDRLKVKFRDGAEAILYFDASIPLAATARLLTPHK